MSSRIGIFVATMTGTAEMCAEEIQTALGSADITSEIVMMDGLDASALGSFDGVVIVSSTYGHGDIPDNGQAFFESISAGGRLTGRRFAVFGLGDRTYMATFCEAAQKWDALLESKGAFRFAPLVQHDASSGTLAEDAAAVWAAKWAPEFKQAA